MGTLQPRFIHLKEKDGSEFFANVTAIKLLREQHDKRTGDTSYVLYMLDGIYIKIDKESFEYVKGIK